MKHVSKLFCCCAVLALCMSVGVIAEDTAPAATPEAQMPPMGPPPELQTMSYLMGDWDCTMQSRMCDTCPWIETKGAASFSKTAGGAAIMMTYKGDFMGMPFEGAGVFCYNRNSKKWQSMWTDNMAAMMSLKEGDYADGKLILFGQDEMPGMKWLARETTSKVSDTSVEWVYDASYDSGKTYMTMMKASYTKKK